MSSALEEFRAAVRRLQGGRRRQGRRYDTELRALAVRHVVEQQRRGRRIEDSAEELGIHPLTARRWLKARPAFRQVEVSDPAASTSYVIVTPDGFRIEGVGREDLGEILSSLR